MGDCDCDCHCDRGADARTHNAVCAVGKNYLHGCAAAAATQCRLSLVDGGGGCGGAVVGRGSWVVRPAMSCIRDRATARDCTPHAHAMEKCINSHAIVRAVCAAERITFCVLVCVRWCAGAAACFGVVVCLCVIVAWSNLRDCAVSCDLLGFGLAGARLVFDARCAGAHTSRSASFSLGCSLTASVYNTRFTRVCIAICIYYMWLRECESACAGIVDMLLWRAAGVFAEYMCACVRVCVCLCGVWYAYGRMD